METTQEAVLVTGGASGIGLAVVRGLLDAGRRVLAADLSQERLDVMGDIAPPERLGRVRLDVSDEAQVVDALARQESAFGPIGGLVNSAGIGQDLPFLDTETAALRRMLEVNLVGPSSWRARSRAACASADMAPSSTSPRCRAYAAMPDARPTARPRAGGDADARDGGRTG